MVDITFIAQFVFELCYWIILDAFMFQALVKKRFDGGFISTILVGTVYGVFPYVVKLPVFFAILEDCFLAGLAAILVIPAIGFRIDEQAKKHYAKRRRAPIRSSVYTLNRVDKIISLLLVPSVLSCVLVLNTGPFLSAIGISLLAIVIAFMIYHIFERTYRTTFFALFLNTLVFSILLVLYAFDFVLKGQLLVVPLLLIGGIPAAIIYSVQLVVTRSLYKTRFSKETGRYVIRIYSLIYWSFFVLFVTLADMPLVVTFLSSQNLIMMRGWSAGITPFILSMFVSWGTEVKTLKMVVEGNMGKE